MKNLWYYNFPIGTIGIIECNKKIIGIFFKGSEIREDTILLETPLIKETYIQLLEYFKGTRKTFNVPLLLKGTSFQNKVWEALLSIPYGETRTYKQIASQIGNSKACRAVGLANNHNPICIVVPCHRVIGANGHLTGYSGGLKVKKYLLGLEQENL